MKKAKGQAANFQNEPTAGLEEMCHVYIYIYMYMRIYAKVDLGVGHVYLIYNCFSRVFSSYL